MAQALPRPAPPASSGPQKRYHFVFVNHVTTNPFFTPTQYGIADACSLLGCIVQWTGSASSNVPADGDRLQQRDHRRRRRHRVRMIDPKAFTGPTANALKKGIPVLAYNADEPNGRLAYIGQDLFVSGQQMGEKILTLVPSGNVALFIATPGSANIQPRIDGANVRRSRARASSTRSSRRAPRCRRS